MRHSTSITLPNNKNPAPIQPPQEQNDNAKVCSYRTLLLSNAAVTTSGDAFQHVEIAGNRYSHIVDPHTGLGLTDRSSVTIIARDCMTADSLATAASVLGPRAGLELVAATPGAEGLFVRQPKTELEIQQSRGWSRFEVAVEEPASQQP